MQINSLNKDCSEFCSKWFFEPDRWGKIGRRIKQGKEKERWTCGHLAEVELLEILDEFRKRNEQGWRQRVGMGGAIAPSSANLRGKLENSSGNKREK